MTHDEFVAKYRSGQCSAMVHKSFAMGMMGSRRLAKRYRYAHLLWSWVWLLSIPLAVVVGILTKWWIGVIVFGVGMLLPRAIKRSAEGFVLDGALENAQFFDEAIKTGALKITDRSRSSGSTS